MASYFNYFPTTIYRNAVATNVIAKARFNESIRNNGAVFYTYTIREGERPDQIASTYYQDPELDWLIYLANDIVDPYHDWPKDQRTLDAWIAGKYGSIEAALIGTAFYRVNYLNDDRIITTAAYTALSAGQKQYWNPILGYDGNPNSYERKKIEITADTNRILQIAGTFDNVATGTVVKQGSNAFGTVGFANSTTLSLKHITGTWSNAPAIYTALSNTAVSTTISSVNVQTDANGDPIGIPTDEIDYWSPVSLYDYESELNENKKHIRILHNAYVQQVQTDMKEIMSNG